MRFRSVLTVVCLGLATALTACGTVNPGQPNTPATEATATPKQSAPLDENPPTGRDETLVLSAIERVDGGDFAQAIRILKDVHARIPNNAIVLHELALAYRLSNQNDKAIELLLPRQSVLTAFLIADLASAYDDTRDPVRAERILRAGLAKYPKEGILHADLGATLMRQKRFEEALDLFLRGMAEDPRFAGNYIRAAEVLADTKSKGLAAIYAEIFRLLEPTGKRSEIASKLIVDMYREGVHLSSDGQNATISLAPNLTLRSGQDLAKMPFENAYEISFGLALTMAHRSGFSLASLHNARVGFLKQVVDRTPPYDWSVQPLIPWLVSLAAAGHLEAYDVWMFSSGFPQETAAWLSENKEKLERMVVYLKQHPIALPRAR